MTSCRVPTMMVLDDQGIGGVLGDCCMAASKLLARTVHLLMLLLT
jgi:hypothetical protein